VRGKTTSCLGCLALCLCAAFRAGPLRAPLTCATRALISRRRTLNAAKVGLLSAGTAGGLAAACMPPPATFEAGRLLDGISAAALLTFSWTALCRRTSDATPAEHGQEGSYCLFSLTQHTAWFARHEHCELRNRLCCNNMDL